MLKDQGFLFHGIESYFGKIWARSIYFLKDTNKTLKTLK